MTGGDAMYLNPAEHLWATLLGTASAYLKKVSAYAIELIRWPLGQLLMFVTWRITYGISGRGHVDGATVSGFLLIGVVGYVTWTSSIWASGYALEFERYEGTSAALFLSPASRAAVVAGYGLGSFVWFLPSFAGVILIAFATGARLHVADPAALAVSLLALFISSLALGFALSGLFILSRHGNLIANVIQSPMFLLGGLLVPLSALPGALRPFSDALPATHAVVALRQTALLGASWQGAGREVLLALALSAGYWLLGLLVLRRVEYVAKRHGQLDLY